MEQADCEHHQWEKARNAEKIQKNSSAIAASGQQPGTATNPGPRVVTAGLIVRPADRTAVLEPHQPYLRHLEVGFQVSVWWAELPPVLEHHQDLFKDKFCRPIRLCLGSFARKYFFARYAQLFGV